MAIVFPAALDNLTNPTPTSDRAALSHAGQHSDANDAIEALQRKVGVDNSGVTTSLDYKVTANTTAIAANAAAITAQAPDNIWGPGDLGLIAWNYEPTTASNQTAATNGTLYLMQLNLRYAKTITNLCFAITVAGTTPTASQNYLGLYNAAGTLVAATAAAALDTPTTTTGFKSIAVSTPYAAAAGKYWVGLLLNATTPAQPTRAIGTPSIPNLGLAAANLRFATNGTGLTALPGSITPASNSAASAVTYWAAAS